MTVGIWRAQVRKFRDTLKNFALLDLFSDFPLAEKQGEKVNHIYHPPCVRFPFSIKIKCKF